MAHRNKNKLKKAYKCPNRNTFVKGKLRQASLRWPPRNEALKRARYERGMYRCAFCEGGFKDHQVHLDHILPVVAVQDGFVDWNHYIERLFPDADGFQVLCETCHNAKTAIEDKMRVHFSNKRKEK